jgi:hypothetical protein
MNEKTQVKTKKPYPWIGLFGLTDAGLRSSGFRDRNNADRATLVRALDGKFDHAIFQCEQGVVLANADIRAGMELGSTLTHQDIAGGH